MENKRVFITTNYALNSKANQMKNNNEWKNYS